MNNTIIKNAITNDFIVIGNNVISDTVEKTINTMDRDTMATLLEKAQVYVDVTKSELLVREMFKLHVNAGNISFDNFMR